MVRHWLIAGAVVFGAATPALADHPAPTDAGGAAGMHVASPDTLEQGAIGAGVRVSLTLPDKRSDAMLEALAGAHVHAHDSDYTLNAALGVSYGLTDRLTISAELPYRRMDSLRAGEHSHHGGGVSNEVVQLGSVSGLGDLRLMAKFRVAEGLALIGGVKAPTGETDKESADGELLETEHQPGSGSWDPIAGAAFATDFGALTFTAGGLYQFSGEGDQDTELGDRAQVGVALSRHFGPEDHHDEEGVEPHGHASWDAFGELTYEWEDRQAIARVEQEESGGKVLWLSPGARYTTAGGTSLAGSISFPVWQDIGPSHPESRIRLSLSVGRLF
ncbi:MAG TPA: transporter [Caulobacteraceae bacterium]|nr:transporter [Caulobacteraceae bacterium]